jgi:hypothetical protein
MSRAGVSVFAVLLVTLAIGVVDASSAWSYECLQVSVAGTGNLTEGCKGTQAAGNNWIRGTISLKNEIALEEYCAEVETGFETGVSGYATLSDCKEGKGSGEGHKWIRVKAKKAKGGTSPAGFTKAPAILTIKGIIDGTVLTTKENVIECASGTNTGEITSTMAIGKMLLKLTGCKGKFFPGSECQPKSPGAGTGEIDTKELKGSFGTVKEAEALSEVGLELQAEEGTEIANLEVCGCPKMPTKIEGTVAGEVMPLNEATLFDRVTFETSSGSQLIKDIVPLSGLVKPSLTAFGEAATLTTVIEDEFGENLEIT